jgi:uncharacterized LabA/DUF88 family protein
MDRPAALCRAPSRAPAFRKPTIAFVDQAYLLRRGCDVLGVAPRDFLADVTPVVNWVRSCATGVSRRKEHDRCGRVYWYDAAFDPTDLRHYSQQRRFRAIARHELVQLRLGYLKEAIPEWQLTLLDTLMRLGIDREPFEVHFPIRPVLGQKAVDTLIALDLVRLADRGALGTALVLAGDSDLTPAVQIARDAGVQITIVTPSRSSVSGKLVELADRLVEIPAAELGSMLRRRIGDGPRPSSQRGRGGQDTSPSSPRGRRPPLSLVEAKCAPSLGGAPKSRPSGGGDPGSGAVKSTAAFEDRTVTTNDGSGVRYVPFVEDGCVGYTVKGRDGTTKIYLSPSAYDGGREPTVVVCIGEHGDPALDAAQAFYHPFAPEPPTSAEGAALPAS